MSNINEFTLGRVLDRYFDLCEALPIGPADDRPGMDLAVRQAKQAAPGIDLELMLTTTEHDFIHDMLGMRTNAAAMLAGASDYRPLCWRAPTERPKPVKLSKAMHRALSHAAAGRAMTDGLVGCAAFGGFASTRLALIRAGYVDGNADTITAVGRDALIASNAKHEAVTA